MSVVLVLFGLIVCTSLAVFSFRYILREMWRKYRERRVGNLVWFQLRPTQRHENSVMELAGKADLIDNFFKTLVSPNKFLGTTNSLSSRRGIASVVWHKANNDEDDGRLRLYVGVSQANINKSMLDNLARAIDCELVIIKSDELPFTVNPNAIQCAFTSNVQYVEIMPEPKNTGMVIKALSNSDVPGVLMMTVEAIGSNAERKRLGAQVTMNNAIAQGNHGGFQNVGGGALLLQSRAVRCTLSAMAESGEKYDSRRLLDMATTNMSSSSTDFNTSSIATYHSKYVALFGGIPTLLFGALGFFWSSHSVLLFIFAGLCALITGATLALPGVLVEGPIKYRAMQGEVTVPPFFFPSSRWYFRSRQRGDRSPGDDAMGIEPHNKRKKERAAQPSDAQVVYLYGSPLLELMSFPQQSESVDIDRQLVPNVGLPSSYGKDMRPYDVAIGVSGTGQPVFMKAEEINVSRFIGGSPEIGKTNALQCEFISLSWITKNNIEITERTGENKFTVTPIWFEKKGKGAIDCYRLTEHLGAVLIDCNNPDGAYRLALEGPRINEMTQNVRDGIYDLTDEEIVQHVISNATKLVSQAEYGFPEGSIGGQARPVLSNIFQIAMLLSPDEILQCGLQDFVDPERPNIMRLGFLLVGGNGNISPGPVLVNQIYKNLDKSIPRERALAKSIEAMSKFIGKSTSNGMDERLVSSRNRFQEFLQAPNMWEPGTSQYDQVPGKRCDIYIDMIAEQEAPVIVNTGPYLLPGEDPNDPRFNNTESFTSIVHSAMGIYALWDYILANFSGRGERPLDYRKYTVIYYDELSHIARKQANSNLVDVFSDVSSEGRSFGAAIAGATQHLSRITENSRKEVESIRTKAWMRQSSGTERKEIMNLLPKNQTNFDEDTFINLKPGQAIAEMQYGGQITMPFTMYYPKAETWGELLNKYNGDNKRAIEEYAELMEIR